MGELGQKHEHQFVNYNIIQWPFEIIRPPETRLFCLQTYTIFNKLLVFCKKKKIANL
jgi:hypothetical protein